MMTVLRVHPGKKPEEVEIEEGLKSLQHEVDGYIEVIYPFTDPVAVVLNEEGKIQGLPYNRALRDEDGVSYDIIAGNFLIVGIGEDNICSLPQEYIAKYMKKYEHPEGFVRLGNSILVVELDG